MEMRHPLTASDAREDVKLQRRSTVFKFILFASGVFLTFSAYCAFLFLQSSINIEHGVGAASVTITYATAALFGVALTPVVMRVFGTKISVIVCQISYLTYVLANMLPEAYTLIPAGVLVGMGEATMWPTMVLFSVHYARCYAKHSNKAVDAYESEFIGYFFSVFQISQVFGNLVSYAILYAGKSPVPSTLNITLLELMDASNLPKSSNTLDLSICGADDCQDPNITRQILYQYLPASQTTLYLMIGVMGAMVVIAIGIHAIFLREIDPSLEAGYRPPIVESIERNGSSSALASNARKIKSDVDSIADKKKTKEGLKTVAVSTIKATLRHLINPRQLLITPFALYNGLQMSFVFSELTRAFASCMLGVDQVGLCMVIFSAASGVVSVFTGIISSRYGRNTPLIFAFLLDTGTYMLCLFWIPTSSTLWVVYLIFFLVGTINGIWQPMVNEMHAAYFAKQQDIAFTVWNLWVLIGIAIQYGWSTSLCVNYKIYVQIGVLCVAVLSYKIGENKRVTKRVDKLYDIVNENHEGSTFL